MNTAEAEARAATAYQSILILSLLLMDLFPQTNSHIYLYSELYFNELEIACTNKIDPFYFLRVQFNCIRNIGKMKIRSSGRSVLYAVNSNRLKITKEQTICTISVFIISTVRMQSIYRFTTHCLYATEWVKRQTKHFCCGRCRCCRRRLCRCTNQKIWISLWVIHLHTESLSCHTLFYKAMLDVIFKSVPANSCTWICVIYNTWNGRQTVRYYRRNQHRIDLVIFEITVVFQKEYANANKFFKSSNRPKQENNVLAQSQFKLIRLTKIHTHATTFTLVASSLNTILCTLLLFEIV